MSTQDKPGNEEPVDKSSNERPKRARKEEPEAAPRGEHAPAQHEGDGWNDVPVQMRD